MTQKNADSLAQFFADIITSRHNQHAMVKIVGRAGMGKSWAGLELAIEVAKCIADKKGGVWQNYFNLDTCLACMGTTEIQRVMKKPKKYSILFLDDIGVPLNSRKWQSETNIKFNNIIQTFRPNHNLVIMSAQAGFLMDKVPRTIAGYEIEMIDNDFDMGITIAKLNQVVMKHKTGKIHYPYLFLNGYKYKRYIFERPPKEVSDRYEIIRAEQLARMEREELEPEDEMITKTQTKNQLLFDVWVNLKEAGYSLREIGKMTHTSYTHISECLSKGGIS